MKVNMTTKTVLTGLSFISATALLALPTVDQESVTLTQNPRSRLVTVNYVLTGDPAVVTVDFQTNNVSDGTWTSIGGEKYAGVSGDVNKLVTNVNSTCTIFWLPTKEDAWPNQRVAEGNFRAVLKAWSTNAPPPYMIVDLQDNPGETRYYPSAEAIPLGITNDLYKTTRLAFRLVPAAMVQYRMGSPSGEIGRIATREPQHLVTFTTDWYMGVYPVTQGHWSFFSKVKVSTATNNMPETAAFPVESVTWTMLRGAHYSTNSAGAYYPGRWPDDGHQVDSLSRLYEIRRVTGLPSVDLPTEAMWEYTCRAGTSTATYNGNLTVGSPYTSLDPVLDEIAWYSLNSGGVTHPVGLKKANPWGFYDMLGNVNEWCLDQYKNTQDSTKGYISSEDVFDPVGFSQTRAEMKYPCHILRGGSFDLNGSAFRSACRERFRFGHDSAANGNTGTLYKTAGFRLCCDAVALK